jgi:hypothetical protein
MEEPVLYYCCCIIELHSKGHSFRTNLTAFSVFFFAFAVNSNLCVHAPAGAATPWSGRGQEYWKVVRRQGPAGAQAGQEVAAQQTGHVDRRR